MCLTPKLRPITINTVLEPQCDLKFGGTPSTIKYDSSTRHKEPMTNLKSITKNLERIISNPQEQQN